MKYSQFNSIVFLDQQFALYNSYSQRTIFLVPELKDLLQAALNEGIENLKSYHPTFYEYLISKEFLIDESVNEVEKVKALSKSIIENENEFILTINPTMNCNFKCWYCYETHIKQSKLDEKGIDKISKFMKKTFENPKIKRFPLSFFGGEPLLYFEKNVIPVADFYIEECKLRGIHPAIGFTTNGFLIDDNFINYFNQKEVKCSLQITLDGYKADHDSVRFVNAKTGSYEKIVQNIHLLIENHFPVRLRVNYTDKNIHNAGKIIDDFLDISQEIKEKYLIFDFHRVWQNSGGDDINEELEDILSKLSASGFPFQTKYSANSVIDPCYADKRNSVTVNYNGDIYKCTARDFTKKNREGFLDDDGNLIWENDALYKRMNSKFKNKPCLTCRIMPLCNGACSQVAMESIGEDYCVFGGDEREKDKIVSQKITEIKANYLN
ncbi:MAG: radical SAM protein [Bacteroidia bacterium]|nr:radical SAM protein [Bacteroidia bacterium]